MGQKHFLIYTNRHKDKEMYTTTQIKNYLEARGQRCSVRVKAQDWKSNEKSEVQEGDAAFLDCADCMIVLGGDGTMLQAVRDSLMKGIPLIGVNLGTLGYMSEIEPSRLEEALERLIKEDYETESRMMLNGKVIAPDGSEKEDWALNDIVISRTGSLQIIKYNIFVNGQFLNDYHADGVIITTPTGSTGYNLSAGGPIVEPKARLLMLTPICPHTLNQRSIILAPDDVIEIEIPRGREGQEQFVEVSFDGSHAITLHTGDRIRIVKSDKTCQIIKLNQVSFLKVLHKKMSES